MGDSEEEDAETAKDSWKDDVPKTQHDGRYEGDEKWDHSRETPFEIHHNQGNSRDEYKTGALFIHEEEKRQSKYNQNPKREVVRSLTIKKLKWWFVMCSWWRNTINGVHNNECGLTLKAPRKKGRNEKSADNIKNVTMFSFCMTILLRGVRTRPLRKGTMTV